MGPSDISIHTREEGTTIQVCGDSNVAEKWINDHFAMGQKYKWEIGYIQKNVALVVEEKGRILHHPDRRLCEARLW